MAKRSGSKRKKVARGTWIGVDLDGTLAKHGSVDDWLRDPAFIGEPVEPMVALVKLWLAEKLDVRIFTARMDCFHPSGKLTKKEAMRPIQKWCKEHIGCVLPITNTKDYWCKTIYDDRAVCVERDTGRLR